MVLSGEVELMLDDGKCVTLSTRDAAVLRGTRQTWRNLSSDTSCKIAVCTIEARQISNPGKLLGATE
ncbi:MAG: hypothetical protein JOZ61_04110 [Verrucomicrobia bacterium]|nr:hypothetical protein [Verrucomicrobiota bacterium]